MKKTNAWNIRHLLDESIVPVSHRTSVLYCRLTDFTFLAPVDFSGTDVIVILKFLIKMELIWLQNFFPHIMVHSESEQGRGQRSRRSFLFTRLGATLHYVQNLQNIVQKYLYLFPSLVNWNMILIQKRRWFFRLKITKSWINV